MAMEVEESETGLKFPCWKPIRRRFGSDAPFFAAGNIERELLAKQIALDITEEEKKQIRGLEYWASSEVFCPIVGCGACLKSLDDFEDHYNARHSASCSVCSRIYPTSRLLGIHVSEAHDSFFQAKVARGFAMASSNVKGIFEHSIEVSTYLRSKPPSPSIEGSFDCKRKMNIQLKRSEAPSKYECLVEGCNTKLKNYKNRQQHLVDKHKFPSSFEFFKKAKPSKKHRQKIQQRKQASHKADDDESTTMQVDRDNIDSLVSAVSKLSTSDSPSSVSFGRRNTRGLAFVPRAIQKEKNEPFATIDKKGSRNLL